MRSALYIVVMMCAAGCLNADYVADWKPDDGPRFAVSARFFQEPNQVKLADVKNAATETTPARAEETAGTTRPEKSQRELDAETARAISWMLIAPGIVIILVGAGLMVARAYTAGIAILSWVPRLVMGIGAALVAIGSMSGLARDWMVGSIAAVCVIWMYYGSKNHNTKMANGHGGKRPLIEPDNG